MSTSPASTSPLRRISRFLPAGRGWWLVFGAILAGLLLFALVLSNKRDEFEFHRAGEPAPGVPGQVFEPLPAPLPAGESTASGMDDRPPARDEAPRIDQQAQSPVPPPAQAQAPVAPGEGPAASGPLADASVPRPLSAPAPDYPSAALRAGASGDVVLRIEVGADGRPGDVTVIGSSRNRALDRAAMQAVRRWRFEPAVRDGVAIPATVQQVISFDAPR
ncbi:energy transducer TonB [Luteimonas kalidii]|uniref:Protein TonB n=1 Tax=Luteimonas kalidii TaxID=3042025 RepID=A0ABT6JSK0_9GAMM|nr:TonB family protein [Luteimonas kalidii]MDH5833660.1 TonB family protein [Luteimonas kalidii]